MDRVWVYPLGFSDVCHWQFSSEDNCQYLYDVVLALKAKDYKVGVAGFTSQWQMFFGSREGCSFLSRELFAWVPAA